MRNEKYVYNKHTLQYEQVTVPLKIRLLKYFGYLSALLVATFAMYSLTSKYFPSPQEQSLQRELVQMEYHFKNLTEQFGNISEQIDFLQEKDAEIHRQVYDAGGPAIYFE